MLTQKQLQLLDYIHKKTQANGVSPSFDEMKEALDLRSKSGIHRLITALEERGFIRRLAHRARAIEILKMPEALGGGGETKRGFEPRVIEGSKPSRPSGAIDLDTGDIGTVKMMGRIAAGVPIAAIADYSRDIPVPGNMLGGKGEHYALEVKGDSMIDAGINDGDVVVIRETHDAMNGEIVVAVVENEEATLKRLRKNGDSIALEAANPAYETRVFRKDQVEVRGKLVGLIRTY